MSWSTWIPTKIHEGQAMDFEDLFQTKRKRTSGHDSHWSKRYHDSMGKKDQGYRSPVGGMGMGGDFGKLLAFGKPILGAILKDKRILIALILGAVLHLGIFVVVAVVAVVLAYQVLVKAQTVDWTSWANVLLSWL
jgi:hypothetical protein